VFDTETIEKIISNELQEKVLKILPISGRGFVNRVFRVETKTAKHIVRLNSANSYDEYQKEVWATNQALVKNIPTPKILKIGIFDNQAFSIQEFINGIEGRDFSADTKFIWKKLGEYAQQIHSIKVGGFGLDFVDMTAGNSQKMWLRYLNYNIESLDENDKLLKLNVLTKAQSRIVKSIFEKLKLRKFNFGLNHGDLSLKNTIIDEFKTVHLIDWGSAEASIIPHHDLIELLKENMQKNDPTDSEIEIFLEGYGISRNELQKMLPDLKCLLLLRSFDKLRWAIDWKIGELKDYVQHAKKAVDKVLN
jgi:fructosamine-3-kinase/uncharacterized protein Usg